ncbi:hypothetical protein [Hydrogenivirga sp.]
MRKALLFGLMGASLLASCGPLVGQKKVEYVPDYVVKGDKVSLRELKTNPDRYFKTYTKSVKWVRYYVYDDRFVGRVVKDTTSVGDWELKVLGNKLTAVHVPTGRVYKLKLSLPFALRYKAVAKVAGNILYVKEAVNGDTYVLDPNREIKEVGKIPRAYLYDDGIAIVGADKIKFCRDYDMKRCSVIDRIKDREGRGRYGQFYRVNGYFVFFVEEYGYDKKVGSNRWIYRWKFKDANGKEIKTLRNVVSCYKWSDNGYAYPFWEETDKQYVYNRDDYYANPYYRTYKDIPVRYTRVAMPKVYVSKDGKGIYYWCEDQTSLKNNWVVAYTKTEGGKWKRWKKPVSAWGGKYAFGLCGDTPLFRIDGIYYNPKDGKKVKCDGKFVTLWFN